MAYSATVSQEPPPFDPSIVRGVAFDGFGTIFDYPVSRFAQTFARIAATLVPPVEGRALWERWLDVGRAQWGQASPEEGPRVSDGLPRPFRPYRETWPEQFAATFAALGVAGDPAASTRTMFDDIEAAGVYPEAAAVLRALQRRFRVALVSNADDAFLRPPLAASGLRFEAVISSESSRLYKPDPAIFELCARRLGLTARDMLYVGDSPRADVAGALRAGLQMAWLDREGADLPEGTPPPHLRIATLDALLPALGLPGFD